MAAPPGVTLSDLRYLTVSFVGFDRHAHTGELLVNRTVAKAKALGEKEPTLLGFLTRIEAGEPIK